MPWIRLNDGTEAHVRMGKRGEKPSERDLVELNAAHRYFLDLHSVRVTCTSCSQAYRASTVDALLHRGCLCGGELRA